MTAPIHPKVARVLSKVYDVPEEDVAEIVAANAEIARQNIEEGMAAINAAELLNPDPDK